MPNLTSNSKSSHLTSNSPSKDELLFLPLGGCNEIGMNLNLYGHKGKWIIVDFGVSFGGDSLPGVDVIMADPSFVEDHLEDVLAIVLTHAHEDHLGAIPYLWEDLKLPVYATPFTAAFLRKKLHETNFAAEVPIHTIGLNERFEVGPFDLEYIALTHSIPEPNALFIRTDAGNIFHTGDWKLDPDPIVGEPIDLKKIAAIKQEGVRAMMCDSTNALSAGHSESEGKIAEALKQVIAQQKGKLAVGCFASNIARLRSIVEAGLACGRKPALIGRSLWRMQETARETGYLEGIPSFLSEAEIKDYPADKVILICTGSQGEPRAALARIARGDHSIKLSKNDTVLFSSRDIPGNELAIGRLQNGFAQLGVEVITASEFPIHASGHPCRDELVEMYDLIRPEILIPVHGEPRHLIAQAKLAQECQIPYQFVPENGVILDLAGTEAPKQIDEAFSGRLGLSGDDLLPLDHESIRNRRKLSEAGVVMITLQLKKHQQLADIPNISVVGLPEPTMDERKTLVALIYDLAESAPSAASKKQGKRAQRHVEDKRSPRKSTRSNHHAAMETEQGLALGERVRRAVRRHFSSLNGMRPIVIVHEVT